MQMLCFAETFCRRRQNTMSGVRSKKPVLPFQLMPQEQCCKPINCCFILCPQRGHFLLFFPHFIVYIIYLAADEMIRR